MVRNQGGASDRLPIGFLAAALLLTGAVLSWMGWETYTTYRAVRKSTGDNAEIERLRSDIVHLDEVLTMSARMAAQTGDEQWVVRYEDNEPELARHIERAREIAPEAYSGQRAELTDDANTALVKMEKDALALVRENRLEAARAILFSPEYAKEKETYSEGIKRFAVSPDLDLRLEQLRGRIVYLDEVLTMSAWMAVESSEPQVWIERYKKNERELTAAIEEAKTLAPEAFTQAAKQTDDANRLLVGMEEKAFELIGQQRAEDAKALLSSEAYKEQKKFYVDGMNAFAGQLQRIADETLQSHRNKATLKTAATITVIASLMVGWAFVLRATRRWHLALVENNRELAGQTRQLSELNRALEQQIGERGRAEQATRKSEERLRLLLESTHAVPWEANAETCQFTYVGPQAVKLLGYPLDEWLKEGFWPEHIHPQDREHAVRTCLESSHRAQDHELEYRMIAADGRVVWVHDLVSVVSQNGEPTLLRGFLIDITKRKQAEQIQRGHSRVLERLASGASLDEVLTTLARAAEQIQSEMLCSVLLLDDEKKHLRLGAAPGLPAFYNDAVDGIELGPAAGSCGTAAYTRQRVIVEDVMTHPFWADYREIAQRAGLRACWSEPILSPTGEILGTLAMYYREPRGPNESDVEFIQSTAYMAGIAIGRKQDEAALQAAHDELEHRVKERTAELAAANEQLTQKNIEHERAERALRESEEKFRAVSETAADGIISADADGAITYFNTAAESLFGYTAAEVMGRPLATLMPKRFREAHHEGLRRFSSTAQSRLIGQTTELAGRRKDGSEFPVELSLATWKTGDGKTAFTGILRDITRRNQADQALRESEQRFRSAFEHTAVGMALLDLKGRYSRVNQAYCQMLGYREDELQGRTVRDVTHPDDVARSVDHVRRLLAGELPAFTIEKRYLHKSGSVVWSLTSVAAVPDDDGNPLYLVTETQDITERKRAEAELAMHQERLEALVEARTAELQDSHARLRMADRLASIGTLTAGVVHDVNNVTMPIRYQLDALKREQVPAGMRRFVESTDTAVEYLQQLARGLRAIADDPKGGEPSDQATVLSDWWVEVKPLMSTALPKGVKLESDLPSNLPPVQIAASWLTQVVLNLICNGVEAMGEHGRLRIWAKADRAGQVVRIGVSDDGVGMTEEVKARAFDPFFTTKPRERSTGLGLWIVHDVAKAAGGSVEIESKPHRGTSVILSLPLAKPVPAEDVKTNGRGRATVSLSDPRTAKWVTKVLDDAGYDVREAQNGDPADSAVWVTEPTEANLQAARRFASGSVDRRIITLGYTPTDWIDLGAAVVEDPGSFTALKSAVQELMAETWREQT